MSQLAPNTAWDAYTLHYAYVERLASGEDFLPSGYKRFRLRPSPHRAAGGEGMANLAALCGYASLIALVLAIVERARQPRLAGWCAALAVATLPTSLGEGCGGWVDLPLAAFALAATAAGCNREYLLMGYFSGCAWGTKQSAPALLLPVVLLSIGQLLHDRRLARRWAAGALLGALLAAPWLTRNYLATGNALYPLFPRWTRADVPDISRAATPSVHPWPFSLGEMLVSHSRLAAVLDDGIPPG